MARAQRGAMLSNGQQRPVRTSPFQVACTTLCSAVRTAHPVASAHKLMCIHQYRTPHSGCIAAYPARMLVPDMA
eukprot:644191-Rhodomonas_salina.1